MACSLKGPPPSYGRASARPSSTPDQDLRFSARVHRPVRVKPESRDRVTEHRPAIETRSWPLPAPLRRSLPLPNLDGAEGLDSSTTITEAERPHDRRHACTSDGDLSDRRREG